MELNNYFTITLDKYKHHLTDTGICINGDSLEVMKDIKSESIDLVLTDPPYNISSQLLIKRNSNPGKFKGKDINYNFGKWDNFESNHDFMEFTYQWIDECVRVLKKGSLFISYFDRDRINFMSHYLQDKYNFKCKGYFIQIKSNPGPQCRRVKWSNGWEMAGLWQKPDGKLKYHYELGEHKDYMIVPIVSGKERTEHPTQKPLVIMKDFIRYWCDEENIVLDPFAGSGTTLVATKELNRKYIGIEREQKYCDIAKERLENTQVANLFSFNKKEQLKLL